jgi:hypothetical protein
VGGISTSLNFRAGIEKIALKSEKCSICFLCKNLDHSIHIGSSIAVLTKKYQKMAMTGVIRFFVFKLDLFKD